MRQRKVWGVVKSEPQRELYALGHLRNQQVECYCPVVFNDRRKRREPFFPSYLFVRLERDAAWGFINNTRGVLYLITMQGRPCSVPLDIINRLRGYENDNGVIPLPGQGKPAKGDMMRIIDGPFKGHSATFLQASGPKRVEMLLSFLGSVQRVTVPRWSVVRQ